MTLSVFPTVMARLVRAIHFPEADAVLHGFWKMDGRHEGGHDEFGIFAQTPPVHSR